MGHDSTFKCPLDRSKFNADKGFKTFHQNKYILSQLKKKKSENCKTHKLAKSLYCNGCQKDVCTMCLSEHHRKHDVVDINYLKREKCEDILKSAKQLDENFMKDVNTGCWK